MWFWWTMLFSDILIPVIMIVAGIWMWKKSPSKINGFIGYRTSLSMKNMDTWKFAHEVCGKLWWKIGVIMLIPSVLIHIPFYNRGDVVGTVGSVLITLQCIVLVASIFPVEKALKNTFNADGSRK